MALQLIYTSAPRLLQAGRTGFGTVAMHQGIPAWLQGEIERASQFSRVPGLDPSRVVTRHMVFGQGDRTHHVLSRIQDAGADYTGRTNHIAHHFIFTAAEAAHATTQGVTPADALKYLESHCLWATNWSGEPRYLTEEESLPVESIPKELTLPDAEYWAAFFPGQPEYAAILAPGKTAEACWIIYPPSWRDYIVYLMGKSLALHKTPWTVSFSNDLQPTDDEQQISWRGIPSDSPLLSKAQSSVRPCLDLSNPGGIHLEPVPEYIEEARTGLKPQPKSRSPIPVATPTPVRSDVPEPTRASSPVPVFSKIPEKTRRKSHGPRTILIGAVVVLLALGGGIFLYQKIEHQTQVDRLKQEIAILLQDHPSLGGISSIQEIRSLRDFGDYLRKGELQQASEIHNGLPSGNPDWDMWRDFCKKQLTDSQKEINRKNLKLHYSDALRRNYPSDADHISSIIKDLNPSDQALWQNALAALKFLSESSKVSKEIKELPLELQDLPQDENIETSKKLHSNIVKRNNEIKALQSNATETDMDGPKIVTVGVGNNATQMLAEHEEPSAKSDQITIYVVANTGDNLVPPENSKWASRRDTNSSLTWNDLVPASNSTAWDKPKTQIHFNKNPPPFKVVDKDTEVDKFFVVDAKSITENIDNIIEIKTNNKIVINSKFKEFISRFRDSKNSEINFNLSSDYLTTNNIPIKEISGEGLSIRDPWINFHQEAKDLEFKVQQSQDIKNTAEQKRATIGNSLNSLYKFISWDEFKIMVNTAIDRVSKKDKNGEKRIASFKKFWRGPASNSSKTFVEKYNERQKKNDTLKDFNESFATLIPEIKERFFYTSGDWSSESQSLFLARFEESKMKESNLEKDKLIKEQDKVNQEIAKLDQQIKTLTSRYNQSKANLQKPKSIQFYFTTPTKVIQFSTTVTLTPPQTTP